ncbi:MAG TPA: PilN domain-containing protein [Gaiellaceae bacterium]|jgi:Tfp pilus assembly protein PilN|nr:PilN domain-containing protein [Gaiellaceae bacterium]
MPDWNKEIKLSDLFGRSKKGPEDGLDRAPAEPSGEKRSLLKKEISFSLGRKDRAPREPKPPKPSRAEARAAKREARAAERAARLSRAERRAAKREARAAERAARPSRAERRAAKREAREAAKAAKAARKNEPKRPRLERKDAPPVPAVPVMRAFNLLPRDDVREGRGRRPSTAQLVLAVVALVAFAGLGAYFLMLNASVADKRSEADSLRAAAAARPTGEPAPSPEEESDTQLQQEQQARTAALAAALGRRVAWDRLLREFSLVVPDDVSLTKLTAAGGGAGAVTDPAAPAGTPAPESTFTIEGYTQSQESVARLLARLSVLPELSTVDLESSVATDLGPAKTKVFQFVVRTVAKPVSGATA